MTKHENTLVDFNSIERNLASINLVNLKVQAIPLNKIVYTSLNDRANKSPFFGFYFFFEGAG